VALPSYAELFGTESGEQNATIDHLLLRLEADPSRKEAVEGIFPAVHTLKGAAAVMCYTGVR
jgi:chemotaxis protein histidine kinase CheA